MDLCLAKPHLLDFDFGKAGIVQIHVIYITNWVLFHFSKGQTFDVFSFGFAEHCQSCFDSGKSETGCGFRSILHKPSKFKEKRAG